MPKKKIEPIEQPIEQLSLAPSSTPSRTLPIITALASVLLLVAIGLGYKVLASATQQVTAGSSDSSWLVQFSEVFGSDNGPLQGESNDRINVLLLGIGGDGHAGGTLTDSIMVASIKPSTNQVALLSLPRDLIVKIYDDDNPKYWEGRKINYAYELGGMPLALTKVSEVTGLQLHYFMLIDFNGFRKIIDDLNGIPVTVPHDFTGLYGATELSVPCPTAQLYNLDDGAYCAIPFTRGDQQFDGEQALIYSRIRKLAPGSANTNEGTDFARAQRQQLILQSVKQKLFSSSTLLRPNRISAVLNDIGDHWQTNLELWEMVRLLQLVSTITTDSIITRVVDESPNGLVESKLYAPTGASVVVPVAGEYNFSDIHQLADTMFAVSSTATTTATIQVLNGTGTNGLAAQTADRLRALAFTINDVSNAPTTNVADTVIYDFTNGTKPEAADLLLSQIGGTIQPATALAEADVYDTTADFIIVLGQDAL
ncbi:MAG: LCP family protein [Candidatus Kerfeldbacteria bacterium]|nr:LCP family protein [Candidatus Kerfeldbacteria bacterium]